MCQYFFDFENSCSIYVCRRDWYGGYWEADVDWLWFHGFVCSTCTKGLILIFDRKLSRIEFFPMSYDFGNGPYMFTLCFREAGTEEHSSQQNVLLSHTVSPNLRWGGMWFSRSRFIISDNQSASVLGCERVEIFKPMSPSFVKCFHNLVVNHGSWSETIASGKTWRICIRYWIIDLLCRQMCQRYET